MINKIPPYLIRQYLSVCRQSNDHMTEAEKTFIWSVRRRSARLSRKERGELQRLAFHQSYKKYERGEFAVT